MSTSVDEAIERARQLLKNNRHAAMATVNADGSPHNTPFFFVYNDNFSHIYWGSHPDAVHSQNIVRTGQIFVVLYDSAKPKMGGIYISARNAHALSGDELTTGLAVHNTFRQQEGKQPLEANYYAKGNPQQMYSADPVTCWVLMSENDQQGLRIRDYRQEINITQLTSAL